MSIGLLLYAELTKLLSYINREHDNGDMTWLYEFEIHSSEQSQELNQKTEQKSKEQSNSKIKSIFFQYSWFGPPELRSGGLN